MGQANDFFTLQSLATFSGTTFAVTLIGNTFRSLTSKDPKIIAFLVSIALCIWISWSNIVQSIGYLIALLNGCLVYCTAMGLTTQLSKSAPPPKPEQKAEQTRTRLTRSARSAIGNFFRPW